MAQQTQQVVDLFAGAGRGNNQRGVGASARHLVEFKCGKLNRVGTQVTADPRKGSFYLTKNEDDQLVHLCWKSRENGAIGAAVEDDLIMFPGDAEFKLIPQANGGRGVYVLKFNTSSQRLFFWIQESFVLEDNEAGKEKEKELITKVNKILKDGPAGAVSLDMPVGQDGVAGLLQGMDNAEQRQLMDLLRQQGLAMDTDTDVSGSAAVEQNQDDVDMGGDSQNPILSQFTPEVVTPALSNNLLRDQLFSHHPGGNSDQLTNAQVQSLIRDPRFVEQVQQLREKLQNGQADDLLQSVGVTLQQLQQRGGDLVLALLKILRERHSR
ncbi:hypothetical protein MIR68_006399 [Amoeboaphelidium protococcarum]|nr:hypothetical protein MIR68_006399 [Amoeboaphelidium protococcarum]